MDWLKGTRSTPSRDEWLVITEPGAVRGLFRVGKRSPSGVVLEGAGSRVHFPADALPQVTRQVLSRDEAEARLAELCAPSTVDRRHRFEQFIEFSKVLSRGSDESVIALLRTRYAQSWMLGFGARWC
ncbi:MAG: hypothetical protein SFW67_23750 [Myxococcaceae bacterium]|nr:hypothetical protein [Myxococcaceae bacterium]